ncbi:hypothetical protein [Cupriavidus oxalaticus]|uniref:Cytochrome c domain-containing protein n=1 Tax=Cupriavidus oxalaticus TaxID=96344 RepID=A0A4P7LH24_9BURK|nr:hypothetical protein [Cupriavidus oxalaticus]QBY55514.1 hypothetical protein E0W60_31340 [Cupriavidus oxalaticus]
MNGHSWFAILCLALTTASSVAAPAGEAAERGRAIYQGEVALTAHLRGETRRLPAFTVRCGNCHTQSGRATAFAPPLSAGYLREATSRRQAPPSQYDLGAFCKVLATGIDPAAVMLASSMPLYVLSDDECTALWTYLLTQ